VLQEMQVLVSVHLIDGLLTLGGVTGLLVEVGSAFGAGAVSGKLPKMIPLMPLILQARREAAPYTS
jgi:hypothetical protein